MATQPAPIIFLEVPDDADCKMSVRTRHLQGKQVIAIVTNWSTPRSEHVCQIQHGERLYSVPSAWLRIRAAPLPTPTSEQTEADAT